MRLWQSMQVSSGGTPARGDRSAPEWQKTQLICFSVT
jgi:hypothetical protein